jgi:hypothetical protein
MRHMLQQPILSGWIRKWAYAFIEYDLAYEPLKSMKDQVVVDFIIEHSCSPENLMAHVEQSKALSCKAKPIAFLFKATKMSEITK